MNKKHDKKRLALKIIGISMAVVGIILEIVGFSNFLELWVMVIVGYIMLFPSIGIITLGFRREIIRRGKNDISPVIRELVKEVTLSNSTSACRHCGAENKQDAKFCKDCGQPLHKVCPFCNAELRDNSKFCDTCGKEQPADEGKQ